MRYYRSQSNMFFLCDLLITILLSFIFFSSVNTNPEPDQSFYITQYSSLQFSLLIGMMIALFTLKDSCACRDSLFALLASRKGAYRFMVRTCLLRSVIFAFLLVLPAIVFQAAGLLPAKLSTFFLTHVTGQPVLLYQWGTQVVLFFSVNAFLVFNGCRKKPWRFNGGIVHTKKEEAHAPKITAASFAIYMIILVLANLLSQIICLFPLPYLFLCCAVILFLGVLLLLLASVLIKKQEYVR